MLQSFAQSLHLSPIFLLFAGLGSFIIIALTLGVIINHALSKYAERFQDSWKGLAIRIFAALPIPLLVLVALYAGLEMLTPPRRIELIGSRLISALVFVVFYFFLGRTVVALLRRLGDRRHHLKRLTQFAVSIAQALVVLFAVYTTLEVLQLPPSYERLSSKVVAALGIVLVSYALAKVVILYLGRLSERDPALQRVTEPAAFVTRAVLALLTSVILLENLGVHLTAVWTTLGIGSVAVGLALQDSLSNLFAGIYLLADRPIRPADYIKFDPPGHEGYVVHVGWRSTTIRTLANNIVVVPNSSISKAVLTNFSRPDERTSLDIRVSIAPGPDPRWVEKILVQVAQEAARQGIDGLLSFPEPSASLIPGFGPSTLDFTLGVQVRRFVDQYAVQSELRKRIWERFQRQGIDLSLPIQTLVLDRSVLGSFERMGPASKKSRSSQLVTSGAKDMGDR